MLASVVDLVAFSAFGRANDLIFAGAFIMNCNTCGTDLPPGATVCSVCNTPVAYNVGGSESGGSSPYDPTVAASPPQYGAPSIGYGAPSYGAPSSSDPYSSWDPYAAPPPPPPNQYAVSAQQYGQAGGYGGVLPPPKRRSRIGLIIGIVAAVLMLACVGICGLLYVIGSRAGSGAPSGLTIDSAASSIISNIQTASAIDSQSAAPTQLVSTFAVQQNVYATADLHLSGQTGFALAKWYANGTLVHTSGVLALNNPNFTNVAFDYAYGQATQGASEIYWCTQADCSDAKLADFVKFTVSSTGMHMTVQPVAISRDINCREL
jgi:hypothetical protein